MNGDFLPPYFVAVVLVTAGLLIVVVTVLAVWLTRRH